MEVNILWIKLPNIEQILYNRNLILLQYCDSNIILTFYSKYYDCYYNFILLNFDFYVFIYIFLFKL